MNDDSILLIDHQGRSIRLTAERREHILEHPEMAEQWTRIVETLAEPETIIITDADPAVHAYHRLYSQTPVTRKYLIVVVKILTNDAFVLTAFFSSRLKKGQAVWPR